MSVKCPAGVAVSRLNKAGILLTALRSQGSGQVRSGISQQAVRTQLGVKVDFNGAYIGSSDRRVTEETPPPSAEECNSLVESE
jgi:hypothetical protein